MKEGKKNERKEEMEGGREGERRNEGREVNREEGKAKSLLFLSKRHHQALYMKTIKNFKQMLNTLVPCSRRLCAAGRSAITGE